MQFYAPFPGGEGKIVDSYPKNYFLCSLNHASCVKNRKLEKSTMLKLTRALLLTGFLFLPGFLFAQFNNNTTSPFSRFGLGDLQPYTFGRTTGMGGASIGSRSSQQINIANPASYTSVDSLSFLFEMGISGKFSSYKNDLGNFSANDINFRYFAISFPVTRRIATSIGLTPWSDVGYDIRVNDSIPGSGNVNYLYYGDGSLSRAYFGLAVRPFRYVSVGANLFYFFGTLNRRSVVSFPDNMEMYSIQRSEEIRLRDFGANVGIQASIPMKNDQMITFGATLENKPTFTAFNSDITIKSVSITVYENSSPKTYSDADTISFRKQVKDKITLPLSAGAGVSYVKKNKLEINADYIFQAWSKAKFPFGITNELIKDRSVIAVGGEYVPDKFSIRSYYRRIAYRGGLRYENSYIAINNQQIKDFGMSFGVGLPIYRSNSTVNISAEIGKRGSTKNNLIRENYAKLNFNVNLYDLWFIKRRFD